MAVNLHLIDKLIDLKCPACGLTYQYRLINLMGFNLDSSYSRKVLGFIPLSILRFLHIIIFNEGESPVSGLVYSRGNMSSLLDNLMRGRSNPQPSTQDIRQMIEEKMEKELAEPHTYIFTCPKDEKQMQVVLHLDNGVIKSVSDPEAATPGNAALYETGKQIQTNSLTSASSFCTSMIGVSTGSVAVYTGLLALVIPKSSSLLWPSDLWAIIPAAGFILAALLFALGAYPHVGSMRLSFPASIEKFRDDTIVRRATVIFFAFIILCAALILAFIFIAWIAGTPASTSPAPSPTSTPTITPTP